MSDAEQDLLESVAQTKDAALAQLVAAKDDKDATDDLHALLFACEEVQRRYGALPPVTPQ